MHQSLLEGIRKTIDPSKDASVVLASYYEHESVPKNTMILRQGEVCRKEIYVMHGLVKSYFLGDNSEHILHFHPEGWLAGDAYSLQTGQPSVLNIKTMEDSEIAFLSAEQKDKLLEDFPELKDTYRELLLGYIHSCHQRILASLSMDGEQRYKQFLECYPDLVHRVPQYQIASYLGITPEFLSKIRRNMSNSAS